MTSITKREYWHWQDAGWVDPTRNDLKGIQDAYILSHLHGVRDCRILEVGGGNSRVLKVLSEPGLGNECWNADAFKGAGNGPQDDTNSAAIRVARCYLGDFSTELPEDYFDYVVSVSVVEHVPSPALEAFFADSARVLRTGGLLLHAIDLYVFDEDSMFPRRQQGAARLRQYLAFGDRPDLGLRFRASPAIDEGVSFRCSFASNSDLAMNNWNRIVPDLRPMREVTQSVSIKAEWVKFSSGLSD